MKFIKNRESFLKENMDLAKSIVKKKIDDFEKLKNLLSKNLGYIGKFTEYLMQENIPYSELEKTYKDLSQLKDKQISIDINTLNYEGLLDKVQESQEKLLINSFISKLPSEQKKLAKELLENERNLLLKVAKKTNLDVLVSKISRYKNIDDLQIALEVFSKDPNNDKDKVIETLKSLKSRIVFNNNEVIIVLVDNYQDIKILGSDTSWCIVGSQTTYNTYNKNRYQFIIYNYKLDQFDPEFKIGFTANKDGSIHAAHDILDKSVKSNVSNMLKDLKLTISSLIPKREPIVYDINKLNSKTSVDVFTQIVEECELEKLPDVLKKLLNSKKGYETKGKLVRSAYNRLYSDRDYVLKSELDKISPEIYRFLERKNNIIGDYMNFNLTEVAFLKGLNMWESKYIISDLYASTIIEDISKYTDSTKLKLSNRLNDIYISNNDDVVSTYKGVKLTKQFECVMIVLNALLGRIKETPDYDKIIKSKNEYFANYIDLLKIPIELRSLPYKFKESDIDYVIKKDYLGKEGKMITGYSMSNRENLNTLNKFLKLIEHLKDHKLELKISKENLRKYMSYEGFYNKNGEYDKIYNLFKKFKLSRLVDNSSVTDGNLTLTLSSY